MDDAPRTAAGDLLISEPGIYGAMTAEQYHADPCAEPSLSSTLARTMLGQSPLHAWTASPRLNPEYAREEKETFDIGTAAHSHILRKGARIHRIDAPDWRSKAAKEERDEARALGRTPLLAHQADAVLRFEAAVRERLLLLGLGRVFSDPGRAELPAFADINCTWCRCMVDYMGPDGWIYDLKTTTDASPEAVRRSVESYGYHIQAAHYLETWRAAGGQADGMRFVFVEKKPPHEVAVVELVDDAAAEDDWGELAREQIAKARRLWRQCLDADDWPGHPPQILRIGAPRWIGDKWADRSDVLDMTMSAAARRKPQRAALKAAMDWQAPA